MEIDFKELEGYMREVSAAHGIRMITMGVSLDGERHWIGVNNDASRKSDAQITSFEVGCVSRTLMALLAMSLQKKGGFDIDGPVSRYVSELADDERFDALTVRHLLQHTAGYEGLYANDEDEVNGLHISEWLPRLRYAAQIFQPGSVVNYESSNALLASEVLTRVGGRSVVEQIKALVDQIVGFRPVTEQRLTAECPGGPDLMPDLQFPRMLPQALTMRIGLDDLLTIGEMLRGDRSGPLGMQHADIYKEVKWIPKASDDANECMPVGYGVGIAHYPNGLVGHDGRSDEHGLCFRISTERKLVLAIGATVGQYSIRNALLRGVLERLQIAGTSVRPRRSETFTLGEIAGTYAGNRIVKVEVMAEQRSVTIALRQEGGFSLSLRGEVDEDGVLNFERKGLMWNPTFFRDPSTGRASLMLGMKAFRRVSSSQNTGQEIRVVL